MNKPIAIVLGGTNPHKALIENLQGRGYYTILVDYLDSPPAADVADEHIQESTLDKDKVLEIAKELKAALVIATCIDQANVTACYVSEKLSLPSPYSYQIALEVSNKVTMKSFFKKNDIPTANYYQLRSTDNFHKINSRYPLVVKPSDTTGSKGVVRVENEADAIEAIKKALSLSRSKTAIVEEYIYGDEIQIDCFVKNSKPYILMINKKNKIKLKKGELQSIGSLMPINLKDELLIKINNILNKIVKGYTLQTTPLFIQAVINDNDISVIEFAPRIGGGLSYKIIPMVTGFNTLDAALSGLLNDNISVKVNENKYYYTTNNIYVNSCCFGFVEGVEKLLHSGIIEDYYQYKNKGDIITDSISSNNRIGAFIVKDRSKEGLINKINISYKQLKLYDTEGRTVSKILPSINSSEFHNYLNN